MTTLCHKFCLIRNSDISRAGRGAAAHGEAAGQGGAGQDGTPTDRFAQETTVPAAYRGIEDNVLNHLSEARTKEILCKPMRDKTRG